MSIRLLIIPRARPNITARPGCNKIQESAYRLRRRNVHISTQQYHYPRKNLRNDKKIFADSDMRIVAFVRPLDR